MAAQLPETRSPDEDPDGTEDTVRPQPPEGTPTHVATPRAAESLSRGATLGRYVILERVATGGMGTVYAAYDPQLDRRIALKVIRTRGGAQVSERAKARLHLEARALARLNHPNVVTVHEVDEDAGRVFVAMEFVEGLELTAWLATTRSWQAILEVFVAAAKGLAAAHGAGLVHRDFKPPNVLVGADGRVRVADFGIARRADDGALDERLGSAELPAVLEHATPDPPEVRTGSQVLGTPAYMAPEQARGGVADARADQFSWAASFYEALFGVRPFERAVLSTAQGPALKKPDLGEVPAWLWAVLERALAWDPAARFASMDAVLDTVTAHRERKRPRWVPVAAVVLLGLVAVAAWAGERTRRQRGCDDEAGRAQTLWNSARRAQLESAFREAGSPRGAEALESATRTLDSYLSGWSNAAREACVATQVRGVQTELMYGLRKHCLDARLDEVGALIEALQHADRSMVEHSADALRGLRRLSSCEHPAAASISPEPAAAAQWVELRKAAALYHLGKNAEAITALKAVAERADALSDSALTSESHGVLGLALAVGGDPKAARQHQHQAAIAAEQANDDELKARAWSALALVEGPLLGNVEEGERMSRYALAAASHLEHSPEVVALVRLDVGQQAQFKGDFATALTQAKAAAEALAPVVSDDDELLITAFNNEALALSKLGKFDEALALYRRSLAGCVKTVNESHPRCTNTLMNLGNTLKKAGQIDAATVALTHVVELREKAAPGSAELGASYSNLAQTLEATHHLDEARSMYQKAQAILEKTLGLDHPNVGIVHANLCSVSLQQKRWDEALAECDRALEIFLARVPKHPFIADLYALEAQAQLAKGDLKKASSALEQSLTRCDAKTCTSQNEPARSFTRAQLLFLTTHDRPGALELASKAREGFVKMKSEPEAAQVTAWLQETGLEAQLAHQAP